MEDVLLEVDDLRVWFPTPQGIARAVEGVSFRVAPGETLGVVGESGCGKSVTALSLLRLVPEPGRIASGAIRFCGEDLLQKTEAEMRALRGNRIAMVFQEPMSSLNPVYPVGEQVAEAVRLHQRLGRRAAWARAVEMLRRVGIPDPERRAREYPHRLSGGTRQRVMIAMALACNPQLLVADEPTTALDVTVQAQILSLMRDLQQETGSAIVLITHDLGVIAEMARRVVVMYAGRVVEEADVVSLFRNPLHPYTEGLLESIPRPGSRAQRLHVIGGAVPNPLDMPAGCPFHPRCPYVQERCRREEPPLQEAGDGRRVRCWLAEDRVRKGAGVA